MNNIYQIKKEYLDLVARIESDEGEIKPDVLKILEINEGNLKDKAVNYGFVIKKFEDDNKIIDAEIKRLKAAKLSNEKKVGKLKEVITQAMIMYEMQKIDSATLKLSLRPSKVVEIIDEAKLSDNFFTTKITKSVNKIALKEAMKDSGSVNGARLIENINLQIK